jgi:small GTP-binding protein
VLLGHGGSGKTTLAESMLFMTGGTDRFGKTSDGNTTCDYDAEEVKRGISISLAMAPVKYKNVKINVLDTPGNFDFAGEVLCGLRAAECAVLVAGAKDGLSVGAERCWKMLGKKPRMIFINRTDEDNSDYQACLDALKGKFGTALAPIVAPVIDGGKVTGIVDLLHNKAYEVKGGKAAACAIPASMAAAPTELTPIDWCAEAAVALRNSPLTVYHLQSPTPPTAQACAQAVAPELTVLPDEEFARLVSQLPADHSGEIYAPLLDYWTQLKTAPSTITVDNALTMAQLERAGFSSPIPGPERLLRAFRFSADECIRKVDHQE